jgi:putative tricarboxylic transport membrane protein
MSKKKQIGACIVFIAFAVFYLAASLQIEVVNRFGVSVVSSVTIPRILGTALLILSGILLLKTAFLDQRSKTKSVEKVNESGAVTGSDGQLDIAKSLEEAENNENSAEIDYVSILLTLASLILFTILLSNLGFIISAFIYMVLQVTILTKKEMRIKKLPFTVVFSVVFSLGVYFLFTKALSLMLPAGILG